MCACRVYPPPHQNFLVPYLLSGFGDSNPALAHVCFSLIDDCGKQYEKEHAEEVCGRGCVCVCVCCYGCVPYCA